MSHPGVVVPVWLLVPVLVLGVLVGAGLGWLMRQRMPAGADQPRRWGVEPASHAGAEGSNPGSDRHRINPLTLAATPIPETPANQVPPEPAPTLGEQSPPHVQAPEPASSQSTSSQATSETEAPAAGAPRQRTALEVRPEPTPLDGQPAPVAEPSSEPEVEALPEVQAPPEVEVASTAEPSTDASPEPPRPPDTLPVEGERLGARMDDVLSELERRYRGRRMGPADEPDAPGEPDAASPPRRPRPQP